MKSIAHSTRPHGPGLATPAVPHADGAFRQAITLLRIGAVLLILYLKFKFLLWIGRRRDRRE
jgi:hypothetical protein